MRSNFWYCQGNKSLCQSKHDPICWQLLMQNWGPPCWCTAINWMYHTLLPRNVKSCFWLCSLAIFVEVLVVDAGLRMIKWTALPSPRASTGMRNGRKHSNTRFAIWSGPFTGWLATPRFNLYHRRHQWPSPLDNNKAAPQPRTQTRSLWKQPLPIQQRQPRLITSSCVFMQPWDLILFLCSGRQASSDRYIHICMPWATLSMPTLLPQSRRKVARGPYARSSTNN